MWKIILFLSALISRATFCVFGDPQVPCYFIFGDSLSDPGNNNALRTMAKADYPPYGIDFDGGKSTGRFTNGKTLVDVITKLLGFKHFIPPFSPSSKDVLKGVNYASGSAGIRSETGENMGQRLSMNEQLVLHKITIAKIAKRLKKKLKKKMKKKIKRAQMDYLSKCLYTVNIGSNDYINNYFLPHGSPTKSRYDPDQFARVLIDQYSQQLETLYEMGARKIAVFNLGLIGCAPFEVYLYASNKTMGACVDSINIAVHLFNDKLVPLVQQLNSKLPGANLTLIDYWAASEVHKGIGFIAMSEPCCKTRAQDGLCEFSVPPCPNRDQHIFWDAFHPTQAVNQFIAKRAYRGKVPSEAYPVNIQGLINS